MLTSSRNSSERVMAKRTGEEEEEEGDEMRSESQSDSVLQLSLTHMCSCFHHFRRRYTDFISRTAHITTFNITVQNAHFYLKCCHNLNFKSLLVHVKDFHVYYK